MVDEKAWRYEVLTWLAPGFVHAVSNPLMAVLNYSQFVASEVRDGRSGGDVSALSDTLLEEAARLEGLMTPFFNLLRKPSLNDLSIIPLGVFVEGIGVLVSTSLRHQRVEWGAEVMADASAITCDVQSLSFALLSAIYGLSLILKSMPEEESNAGRAVSTMHLVVGADRVFEGDPCIFQCKVCCKHPFVTVDSTGFDALDRVRANANVGIDVVDVRSGAFDVLVKI